MGLFSLFRKNKQESASGQGEFLSRSAGDSGASRGRGQRKSGKDAAVDPVLPEKKRARRRLIGAVALVLAVVILLPMLLETEPRPIADDIAIQIPSKDSANEVAPVDAAATPAPAETQIAETQLAEAQPAVSAESAQKEEFIAPAALAAAAVEKPTAPVADKPAEKNDASISASQAPAKTVVNQHPPAPKAAPSKPKSVEKSDESARALAILEGKPVAKRLAVGGGNFVIQVAALATQNKVNELRGKLSDAGITSFTQKVATQSGERTRIRVGPFGSREEADKARAKIQKLGLNATIVPS